MPAPSFRRRNYVLFQHKATEEDADGYNDIRSWEVFCFAWVSINPLRGREVAVQGSGQSTVTHDVRGDWMDIKDVTDAMRMVFIESGDYSAVTGSTVPDGARLFDIIAIMRDEDEHGDVMVKVEEKRHGTGA